MKEDKGGHWVALAMMLAFNDFTNGEEGVPNIVTCHLLGGAVAVCTFCALLAGLAVNDEELADDPP